MVEPGEGAVRPVVEEFDAGRPSTLRRRVAWAFVVLVLVATLVSAVTLAVDQRSDHDEQEQAAADEAAAAVEDVLAGTAQALAGAAGLVGEDGTVSEDRFTAFASGLSADSGLAALGYSPVVENADRTEFEAQTGIEIGDLDPDTGTPLTPAPERARYAPTLYVHPDTDEYREILGFDLLADPTRGALAEQARTTGEIVLISVDIAATGEPGIVLIQPLTMNGRLPAVGFVSAAYSVGELASAAAATLPEGTDVAIIDDDGEVRASTTDAEVSGATAAVDFAGLDLAVVAEVAGADRWGPPLFVLIGGSLLAMFLTLVFSLSFRYERRVEAAQRRTVELLELTSLLTRSLDSEEVAEAVLGRGRRLLEASGGVLAVVADDGQHLRILDALGLTPEGRAGLEGLASVASLPGAVERGESIWLAAPSLRGGAAATATSFATGASAAALVPGMVDGQLVSVTGWTFDGASRARGSERALASAVAAQTARAVDRAARHDREHDLALELQHRLLPVELPEIPGLPVAVRYRAAARGIVVGGDWYDAFELADGTVAVDVGDVVGRGPRAAAVMVQLRSALKGYVSRDRDPAAALRALHEVVPLVDDALCTTCCVVVVDPVGGRVTYARAGHPYPLVVGPDGFRYLRGGAGAPLGVVGGTAQRSDVDRLRPGEHLLLFTDGAIERRGEHLDVGLDRLGRASVAALAAATAAGRASDPEAFVDLLLERLFPEGDPGDDIALLAVSFGVHTAARAPATPAVEATPAP